MSTAFTRLIWKEHRAQRQLWLALLLGCVCLYVIMRLQASPWLISLLTSSIFCVFFLVAATAIAFAGEVDDRTVGLLRMLPCRTSTLMTAKVAAIVTGCLALFLAMAALSGVLEVIGLAFPRIWRTESSNITFDDQWFNFIASMILLFASTLVASIVTKRVISAVGLAAIICFASLAFCAVMARSAEIVKGFVVERNPNADFLPWTWLSFLFFFAIAAALIRPWHLGRLPREWRMPQRVTARPSSRVWRFAPKWNALLKRVVALPMSQHRILATLFWRECRSAIPFGVTWLLIGVAICAGRAVVYSHDYFWPVLFLVVFIHECGQRTMRADQRSGSISLLANIGVSGRSIWLTKTTTWFVLMLAGGAFIVLLDTVIPNSQSDHTTHGMELRILQVISNIRAPHIHDSDQFTRDATALDHWLQVSTGVAWVLMTFSIGQLTACWIQRQILAYAASLLLFFAAGCWINICVDLDYSIWFGPVPVGTCFLLATLFTARRWIDRTVTWKLRLIQAAWLVVPCLVFVQASRIMWTLEPRYAASKANYYLTYDAPQFDGFPKELAFTDIDWARSDSTSSQQIWSRFATQFLSSSFKERLSPPLSGWPMANLLNGRNVTLPLHIIESEDNSGAAELLQSFDQHFSTNQEWPLLPLSWTAPWSNTPAPTVTFLLLADATEREKRGDVRGAIQQHVRAIRLARALANQTSSWNNWNACVASEQAALDSFRQLVGCADLNGVELDAVSKELKDLLVFTGKWGEWPVLDPRNMLGRRMYFWTSVALHNTSISTIRGDSRDMDTFAGAMSNVESLNDRVIEMSSATRQRALSTMYLSTAILNTQYSAFSPGGRAGLPNHFSRGAVNSIAAASEAVQRFAATSAIGDLSDDPTMFSDRLEPGWFPATVNLMAEERATLLTILLQKHRIKHGKFPDSLMDLDEGDDWALAPFSILSTDPWTGAPFFYAPKGLSKPVRIGFENETYRIAVGQPLLFSAGRLGSSLYLYLQDTARQSDSSTSIATLPPNLVFLIGITEQVERWPLHNRVLEIKTIEKPVEETREGMMGMGSEMIPDQPDMARPAQN